MTDLIAENTKYLSEQQKKRPFIEQTVLFPTKLIYRATFHTAFYLPYVGRCSFHRLEVFRSET